MPTCRLRPVSSKSPRTLARWSGECIQATKIERTEPYSPAPQRLLATLGAGVVDEAEHALA